MTSTLLTSVRPPDDSPKLLSATVGQLLRRRAAEHPDQVAIIGTPHAGGTAQLTYRELLTAAEGVAARLAQLTEPGEYVALWSPNVLEWPVIEYGAALAGVVLVALNPVLREHELKYALTHSGATVLIHADASRDYDLAAVAATVAPRCPALRHVTSLADRDGWSAEPARFDALREPDDATAPVMLQYTSGTTGKPKGVLLRHISLVNNARLTLDAVGVRTGSVAVNPLPMFHTAGCVISTLGPLWLGGTMVLVERFEPGAVLDLLAAVEAHVLFYVPAILSALVAQQGTRTEPARQLEFIVGGASPVNPALIEAAEQTFGGCVINLFGQTELAPVLTTTRPSDARDDRLHTVGHPLPHASCKVVDPTTGEPVPLGVEGIICAHGYQQMVGYLHDPDATAATVDADGYVHTGDIGSMDERGYLRITGRLKEIIIRGGENIAPAEIEETLGAHPRVLEVAVFGMPDDRLGELVAAVVRVDEGTDDADLYTELITHCRAQLAPHKVPARLYRGSGLPVTPTGKVQRFRLRELAQDGGVTELTESPAARD